MEFEPKTLSDIYRRFMTDKIVIDEAGRQIIEYTRLHSLEVGSLDLEPMSEEERGKAGELLYYLVRPIEQQFLLGQLSKEEAALQIAPYLSPLSGWAFTFRDTVSSEERKKLEQLLDYVVRVIGENLSRSAAKVNDGNA
jgi:hypothetical protein